MKKIFNLFVPAFLILILVVASCDDDDVAPGRKAPAEPQIILTGGGLEGHRYVEHGDTLKTRITVIGNSNVRRVTSILEHVTVDTIEPIDPIILIDTLISFDIKVAVVNFEYVINLNAPNINPGAKFKLKFTGYDDFGQAAVKESEITVGQRLSLLDLSEVNGIQRDRLYTKRYVDEHGHANNHFSAMNIKDRTMWYPDDNSTSAGQYHDISDTSMFAIIPNTWHSPSWTGTKYVKISSNFDYENALDAQLRDMYNSGNPQSSIGIENVGDLIIANLRSESRLSPQNSFALIRIKEIYVGQQSILEDRDSYIRYEIRR